MFRTRKGSIVIQKTLTSDNRACLERRNALKPTRNKPSGLLAVVLGITTAVASVGLLSDHIPAFAQNHPQPNAQVPVANQPMMQNATPVLQSAPVTNPTDLLRENNRLLVAARTSLAGGDVVTAEQQMQQAVALNAPLTERDDRPTYVKLLIDGYKNWAVAYKTYGNTEQVRRLRAENLALQAEGFYLHKNLETAEKLARDAISQNVGVSAEMVGKQRDPQSILQRINDTRILQAAQNGTLGSASGTAVVSAAVMRQAQEMQPDLVQARRLLQAGQIAESEKIGQKLVAMNVPDSAFDTIGDNPTRLMVDIAKTRHQLSQQTLGGIQQPTYSPGLYASNAVPVQGMTGPTTVPGPMPSTSPERSQTAAVGDISRQASEHEFAAEVQRQITRSQQLMSEPLPKMNDAISNLQDMRTKIEAAQISPDMKRSLVGRVDRELLQMEDYRAKHGSSIELAQNNADVYAAIDEQRKQNDYVEMKLKEFTEEYNVLYRQERYAEAIAVVEKARAIAPKNPVVEQMDIQSMMADRVQRTNALKNEKERAIYDLFEDEHRASIPNVNDRNLLVGPTTNIWTDISKRTPISTVGDEQSLAEQKIYQILEQPITLNTGGRKPLRAVVDELMKQTQMNIVIDNQAIADNGMTDETTSDLYVEVNALNEIKLRSALNMMLDQVSLAYTVRNESLYITTPKRARAELKYKAYYIGDLVIQHENAPRIRPKTGMERYKEAMDIALRRNTGFGVSSAMQAPVQPVSMNNGFNDQSGMSRMPSNILAQTLDSGYRPGGYGGYNGYSDFGQQGNDRNGAAGGGANFGDLMSLIMETIDPDSWRGGGAGGMGGTGGRGGGASGGGLMSTGTTDGGASTTSEGEATIRPFQNTLTFIIRQTEENHQKIADLLKQLRKMNDIQINVEVRFITIEDNFFESIGMDFDIGIRNSQSSKYSNMSGSAFTNAVKQSKMIAGLAGAADTTSAPMFSQDLGMTVNQGSYGMTMPTFGKYDASAGASLGFAILNDIETYFFMTAAQGDSRSNVLQAPKVTLINGQYAMVMDMSERPFVTGLNPVVGDFAVAMQPVIQVIPDGTMLGVDAVVSSDRRYVRMNLSPMFSTVSDTVQTYNTATGDMNQWGDTSGGGNNFGNLNQNNNQNQQQQDGDQNNRLAPVVGGTVMQPVTTTFTVMTSVSVPDGGTILLGGVKRLREGRKEYGVPMINKIPYLKRLFSNSAVGRETQSMMLMVTPHIIIQEEFEESMNSAVENR